MTISIIYFRCIYNMHYLPSASCISVKAFNLVDRKGLRYEKERITGVNDFSI